MYKRVLLAYDGTVEGRAALREGALIAKRYRSQVYLLSVIPETTGVRMAEGLYSGPVSQQSEAYKSILADGVARLELLGFSPIAKQVSGEPAPQIGAYAKYIKADLVVVGHRRQSLMARWWSGSTGGLLVDNIDCTILISRNLISDETFRAEMDELSHA